MLAANLQYNSPITRRFYPNSDAGTPDEARTAIREARNLPQRHRPADCSFTA
jgi:hypothetical protein